MVTVVEVMERGDQFPVTGEDTKFKDLAELSKTYVCPFVVCNIPELTFFPSSILVEHAPFFPSDIWLFFFCAACGTGLTWYTC